jgi:1,4-dihydroxy-2-naphthoate octaprenyltransferase
VSELITLSRHSADFKKYILGTFSKKFRALPVETLSSVRDSDEVTFQIVPVSEIKKPIWPVVFLKTIRVRQFIFVLFPLFYLLLQNRFLESVKDVNLVFLSLVGVVSLFASLQLRNDFHDHLNGLDRIRHKGLSTPLLQGWVTAKELSQWAWFFVGVSAVCSVPLIFVFPQLMAVLLVSTLALTWSLYRPLSSFKNIFAGEVVFGFLVGPLLAIGFQISVTGEFSFQSLFFGLIWGAAILFRMYLQSFENMAALSQAKVKNILNVFGFDRSKLFILCWWGAVLLLFVIYHLIYFHFLVWAGTLAITLFFSYQFFNRMKLVQSPLGSPLVDLQRNGQQLFDLLVSLWVLQCLFSFFANRLFGMMASGI